MKSLKAKLTAMVVTLFVLALSGLAELNYWQAQKIILQDIERELALTVQAKAVELGGLLENNKTNIVTIASSPTIAGGNREVIIPYIKSELERAKIYESLVWVDEKGAYFDYNGATGNLEDRDYFQRAIKGETVISDPVISKKTNKPIIAIATPIRSGGRVVGVLAGLVDIEEIQKIALEIKVGNTGYAYILRGDGTIIVHPNKEMVLKTNSLTDPSATPELKAATAKMTRGELGIVNYSYLGISKYLAYAPIPGTKWSIGVNVPVNEVTVVLDGFTRNSVIISIVILIIAAGAVQLLATRITKPLKELELVANQIALGDLTRAVVNVFSKDELGHLARSFEVMGGNLRSLVQQINGSSEQVAASSEELTANAEQLVLVTTQVTNSVASTAHSIELQVAAVDKALGLAEKIASSAQSEAAKSETTIEIATKAVELADAGNKAVEGAVSQMNNIRQTVDHSALIVTELGEQSKEIGQIVETISGIAGQTNLLALNAAIEAARAGEQGRGFAVVAEEVRKLAEQSQEAAKRIATLISDIQGKTENAVKAMANGTQEVKKGSDVVDQAGKSFSDIELQIKKIVSIASEAATGMEQLTDSSQQVLESVKQVEYVIREISDQAQNISAATEEQSASMEEIATASHHLSQLAEQLSEAVNKFRV